MTLAPTLPAPAPRLGFVDGLRALAIISVFLMHSNVASVLPYPLSTLVGKGYVGVQLFMVVSGLTLMHAWHGRAARGMAETRMTFLLRRWFRLAPLYLGGIVLYQMLLPINILHTDQATVQATSLNILLLHDWVRSAQNTVVPGGWSIGAEASFYLLFAVLVPWIRKPWHAALLLVATISLHGPLQHAYTLLTGIAERDQAKFFYFWPVRQAPAFMAGIVLYFLMQKAPNRTLGLALTTLATLGLLALTFGHAHLMDKVAMHGLCFCLLALGFYHSSPRWLVSQPMRYLGRISYSIYVLHFAVLALALKLKPLLDAALTPAGGWVFYMAGCTVLTIGLAGASTEWIEQPMIRLGSRLIERMQTGRIATNGAPA